MGKTKKVQDGLGGGAEAAELFTVEQLTEISQNRDPVANDLAGYVAALIPKMRKGGIVTKNRITAFLANVCQETGDNIYGPGYFEGYMEAFDLQEAKRWAQETRSGVLLGRKFV